MAKKPLTKGQVVAAIAEATSLTKKQVGACFTALSDVIKKQVGKSGPGVIAVAGLMKVTVLDKKAVKARKGINPFTKEEQMFKAKPARRVVKVRALKALKDMV